MGKKILLVDDDLGISSIIKDMLEAADYKVEICDNGREAMKAILAYKPDLLLLDVMLPGLDGYTLATKISEGEGTRDLPVIVISGLEPSEAMFRGFSQVAAFIHKPFNTEELLELIRKTLDK